MHFTLGLKHFLPVTLFKGVERITRDTVVSNISPVTPAKEYNGISGGEIHYCEG